MEKYFTLFIISSGDVTFSQVVMEVTRQLEGAYALIFKSPHYNNNNNIVFFPKQVGVG